MLYYVHTQTYNKYKDRTQTVLLTKPPRQRTSTCLTNRNMIIFCPKRNTMTFPEPQDTTHADEVCIATRKSKPASVVANIDGTMYVYFHEAPQALNKVLRDVYTSKLSARLSELEKDQEKHAIKLIRTANATTKSPLDIPKSVSVYELKRVQETFAKYDAISLDVEE